MLNDTGGVVFSRATDYLVIGHYLSAAAVGPYYFAAQAAMYAGKLNVIWILQSVVAPAFFEKYTSERASMDGMYRLLVKMSLFAMLPAAFVFPVVGRDLIQVLVGERFAESYVIVCILIALTPVDGLAYATGLVLQATEHVQHITYSRVFALFNLGASILLVQQYGIVGVAIATASAVGMKNAYLVFWAMRLGGVRLPWGGLGRLAANSGASAGVALAVVSLSGSAALGIVAVIAAAAAYLAIPDSTECSPTKSGT